MLVRVKKAQLNHFRTRSRNEREELFAYLVGTIETTEKITVTRIAYPRKDEIVTRTESLVEVSADYFRRVREEAEEKDELIVGYLHSHPNYWPVKSDTDHDTHVRDGLRVCGICAVMNRRTKVVMWVAESSLPCDIEYY